MERNVASGFSFLDAVGGVTEAESNQRREQEFKNMQEALMPLKSLKLDSSEYACLKAIILFRTSKLALR